MKILKVLSFTPGALASALSAIHIDSRSLFDIYSAAQQESGILQVAHGGDGTYFH
jgi:hypothetical protein